MSNLLSEVMLSPEDVAWADSCLSKDPDMLDAGWNSLKDALFEAFDAQHDPTPHEREYSLESDNMDVVHDENTGNDIINVEEKKVSDFAAIGDGADWNSLKDALFEAFGTQHDPTPYEREYFLESYNMDVVPDENTGNDIINVEEIKVSDFAAVGDGASSDLSIQFQSSLYDIDDMTFLKQPVLEENRSGEDRTDIRSSDRTPISIADASDRAEATTTGVSNHENAFWSKHKMEDVFLPTYDENLKDLGLSDPEVDFAFQEFKLQQSTEDIFKVWDFDIPSEENDLIKQLDKALAGNPAEPSSPLISEDSEAWKGLHDRSLDDLISGIADLTLSPNSDQRVLI